VPGLPTRPERASAGGRSSSSRDARRTSNGTPRRCPARGRPRPPAAASSRPGSSTRAHAESSSVTSLSSVKPGSGAREDRTRDGAPIPAPGSSRFSWDDDGGTTRFFPPSLIHKEREPGTSARALSQESRPERSRSATSTRRPGVSVGQVPEEAPGRKSDRSSPVRHDTHRARWARATRNPRLSFRFSGAFLLRFADRQFCGLLFQLPPRITREAACDRPPPAIVAHFGGSTGLSGWRAPPSSHPSSLRSRLRFTDQTGLGRRGTPGSSPGTPASP
jgi:hypothetical protein